MKYWSDTNLSVGEVRRRAMQYFGQEAVEGMTLVTREPDRLLFSEPSGDLVVRVNAGRPNTVSVITTHWHAQAQEFLNRRAEPLEGVIHYEAETEEPAPRVMERAREFFGQGAGGLGLALSSQQPERLVFSGGGGQVQVTVHGDGRPRVEVAAREWHYQAEQFLRQLAAEH